MKKNSIFKNKPDLKKNFNENCPICKFHSSLNKPNSDMDISILFKTFHWILRISEKEKFCNGYLYLEPVGHFESFHLIPSSAYLELGEVLDWGMKWIEKNYHPLKIYTVTISEMVPHIHFHLIPRYTEKVKGIDYIKLAIAGDFGKLER